MKLALSSSLFSLPNPANQNILRYFFSSDSSLKGLESLYSRISRLGDPTVSLVPVLDQWSREGRSVNQHRLRDIVKEFYIYRRYKHALEISEWMSDKMWIPLSTADVVSRLNLISRVHGLEQAENYFNSVPQQFKKFRVHTALLNCYALEKNVEKAESIMQKLRDMGSIRSPLPYNILMNLYHQMGSWERMDELMHEMEEKGIRHDSYTFSTRLSAYAAASDSEGIDNMVARMESDPYIVMDCSTYSVAADGYLKVGQMDKALEMLKKLEGHLTNTKRRNIVFNFLLKLYAEAGKKDELYRIWKLYKAKGKICNKGYISMIGSLVKFNDIEGAEKLFQQWESKGLSYDFRIPNFLIDAYCRNGLLEKAEALIDKAIKKGGNPIDVTWYYLAGGYLEGNQFPKAVNALKKAISADSPVPKLRKNILKTCLEYLEGTGDEEQAEEFVKSLKMEGIFSTVVHENLLNFIKCKN